MNSKVLTLMSGFALVLSACTTIGSPEDLGALAHTEFTERTDGSAFHKVMGLTCPAEIEGRARTSTHVYNDAGTDVSCNYGGDGRIFTLYLSQYPQYELPLIFQDAQAAIENRFAEEGYKYNEDLSSTCSSQSIDTTSVLSGFSGLLSGKDTSNEITISPTPSAVYVSGSDMTLVTVEEMFDNEYFKVRYSGPYDGEASVETICKTARNTYLSTQKSVNENRGIVPTESDSLIDLINALDGS